MAVFLAAFLAAFFLATFFLVAAFLGAADFLAAFLGAAFFVAFFLATDTSSEMRKLGCRKSESSEAVDESICVRQPVLCNPLSKLLWLVTSCHVLDESRTPTKAISSKEQHPIRLFV